MPPWAKQYEQGVRADQSRGPAPSAESPRSMRSGRVERAGVQPRHGAASRVEPARVHGNARMVARCDDRRNRGTEVAWSARRRGAPRRGHCARGSVERAADAYVARALAAIGDDLPRLVKRLDFWSRQIIDHGWSRHPTSDEWHIRRKLCDGCAVRRRGNRRGERLRRDHDLDRPARLRGRGLEGLGDLVEAKPVRHHRR